MYDFFKRHITIALIIALILVATGSLYAFHHPPQLSKGVMLAGQPLAGKLYVTLKDPQSDRLGLSVSTFDLSTGKLAPFFTNTWLSITPAISSDGSKLAFAARPDTVSAYQIYVTTPTQAEMLEVTRDANQFKQDPSWSHNGKWIAYTARISRQSAGGGSRPNDWSVFLTGTSTQPRLIGIGTSPFFTPHDTTVYALQNDGLHAILLDQSAMSSKKGIPASTLVLPTITGSTTLASQSMRVQVSPDGKHLVWTAPHSHLVRVFSVSNWAPFTATIEKDIPVSAQYAVFSPDSQYLALEQVTYADGSTQPSQAEIVVYRLSDYTSASALDLGAYDAAYTRLTAWY